MNTIRKLIPVLFLCELLLAIAAQGKPQSQWAARQPANLDVAATATSARSAGGWQLAWEVSIGNRGPGPADDVVIEAIADDSLRQLLKHIRIDAHGGARCIETALVCRIAALPAGAELRLRFRAELTETANRRSAGLEFRVAGATRDTEPCDNHYYSTAYLE